MSGWFGNSPQIHETARNWARAQGISVPKRGPVSQKVLKLYEDSLKGARAPAQPKETPKAPTQGVREAARRRDRDRRARKRRAAGKLPSTRVVNEWARQNSLGDQISRAGVSKQLMKAYLNANPPK